MSDDTILEKMDKLMTNPDVASELLRKQAEEILELKRELSDYKSLCGQLYQVVGTISLQYPYQNSANDDSFVNALDLLSEGFADGCFHLKGRTMLPFTLIDDNGDKTCGD